MRIELENFINSIAELICDKPDELEYDITETEGSVVIEIWPGNKDAGYMIGPSGCVPRAMKHILMMTHRKYQKKVAVFINKKRI